MTGPAKTFQIPLKAAAAAENIPRPQVPPSVAQTRLPELPPEIAGLQLILQIERDVRRAKKTEDLNFLMANETRKAAGARQVFVLAGQPSALRVTHVSSLSSVERRSPLIQWIESCLETVLADPAQRKAKLTHVNLNEIVNGESAPSAFPFLEALIAPIQSPGGNWLGALILVSETKFGDSQAMVLQRLAETYGHACAALSWKKFSLTDWLLKPAKMAAGSALILLAGFIPVPLTALAPVEIVPRDPFIVASPIDGTIESIPIDPNQPVKAGDVIVRFVDVQARGTVEIAAREVAVAEAKLRQVSQLALVDPSAKRELAIASSELRLRRAELSYAQEILDRSILRAARDGIAVFADKRELVGRPISAGQRIMEVADPAQTQFRFNVAAEDAIVMRDGATARVFMDADPLRPVGAEVTRIAAMARINEAGALVLRADAKILNAGEMPPLGHRGTAQISGEKVSLAFYLLRRPLAAFRQKTGL